MICPNVKESLPDLLLSPETVSAEVRSHVAECAACGQELRELQATMAALDAWEAPEVSPYFDGRMAARLREEQQARPAGWLERIRVRLQFGDKWDLRPMAAAALALIVAVGGGMYAGFTHHPQVVPASASPVIGDLQSLDENAQVFQQLNTMDQQETEDGSASPSSL